MRARADGEGAPGGVGDGEREGVGGVGALDGGDAEQDRDHPGDLLLLGPPGADDRLLHHRRRVGVDLEAGLARRQQRDPAGVAQREGALGVDGEEDLLDRAGTRGVRPKRLDEPVVVASRER